MDSAIMVEENDGIRDHSASASKCKSSTVKIDSIYIDLSHAFESSKPKDCEHFSIRGYVAKIREKDPKICRPFALDDKTCMLPALHVPRFRWWHCQNCLHDIAKGHAEVDANKKLVTSAHCSSEINPTLFQKINADGTVAIKTQCNGFVDFNKAFCGSHEVSDRMFAIRNLKGTLSSFEVCQNKKQFSVDSRYRDAMTACGTSERVEFDEKACHGVKDHRSQHPYPESLEYDCGLSEAGNDGTVVGKNQQSGTVGVLHQKKTQKVRLLTELLSASKNTNIDHVKKKDATSKAISSASVKADSFLAPSVDVARDRSQNNKRKASKDDEWRPSHISSPKKVKKKVRFSKGDPHSFQIKNAIASSEVEVASSCGLSTNFGNESTKGRTDRNFTPINKEPSNAQIGYEVSSSGTAEDGAPEDIKSKARDADIVNVNDNALIKSACGLFNSGDTNHSFRNCLPAPSNKKKSSLCKKKKMPLNENAPTSIFPWSCGVLNQGPVTAKDAMVKRRGPKHAPCQSALDFPHQKEEVRLSAQEFLPAQRSDNNHLSQVEDGQDLLLLRQENISRAQMLRRNANEKHVGISSNSLTSGLNETLRRQESCGVSASESKYIMMSTKQNSTSISEAGTFPIMQQKDFSNIHTNAHGHFNNIKRDQMADKVLEQGTSDDIPMDIVELMAKNQYDRCLHDARDKYYLSANVSNKRNDGGIIDFSGAHRKAELRVLPEESLHVHKVLPTHTRNAPSSVHNTPQLIKESSDSLTSAHGNHFNLDRLKGALVPVAFFPSQQMHSSGVQFSAASSSRGGAQTCRHENNDNIFGPGFLQTTSHASEECNQCQSVSEKHNEAAIIWSKMSNDGHADLHSSQMTQRTNTDMLSQCPAGLHKGQLNEYYDSCVLDMNAPSPKKQHRNLSIEQSDRARAGYPLSFKQKGIELRPKQMGSSDLYPSEVPAMHLLSLMDAGFQSRGAFSTEANSKLLSKTSLTRDHYSEEFPGLGYGVNKTGDASKYSSSEFYGENNLPAEKSCRCSLAIPTASSLASLLSNRNSEGVTGAFNHASMKSSLGVKNSSLPQVKRGRKRKEHVPTSCGNTSSSPKRKRGRPRKSLTASCSLGPGPKTVPVQDLQRMEFGASDSVVFRMQHQAEDDLAKHINRQPLSANGSLQSANNISETEICSINRNPAEFSLPEAGNAYTIGAEDLKFKKAILSGNRSALRNHEWLDQQRTRKLTAIRKSNVIKWMDVR